MILETERLQLREYEKDDWQRVHIYGSDPDFSKYEIWGPNTMDDTHKFIGDAIESSLRKPRYQFNLAVVSKEDGILIGGCGIRRESESSSVANLGWAITPEYQNKGFATEAAKRIIEFGFEELDLKVIYATCDSRNAPSARVMEKLEMKPVGLIRGSIIIKGHKRDSFRYELTASS